MREPNCSQQWKRGCKAWLVLISRWSALFDCLGLGSADCHFRLFHLFVARFSSFKFLESESNLSAGMLTPENDDLEQCLYFLQKLSSLLQWSPESTWSTLEQNTVSSEANSKDFHAIGKLQAQREISISDLFERVGMVKSPSKNILFTFACKLRLLEMILMTPSLRWQQLGCTA